MNKDFSGMTAVEQEKEEMLKNLETALETGVEFLVCGIWYFCGKHMQCGEPNCCDGEYDSYREAAESIVQLSSGDSTDIEVMNK